MPRIGYAGRPTCEQCKWIDVRRWRREGHLNSGGLFSVAWSRGGEPSGRLFARTEADAVILIFQAAAGGKLAQQRPDHLDGMSLWRSSSLVCLPSLQPTRCPAL
jgi:hypothetical protein